MPYAVTCRSCGARFSVADDLVHKKLTGKSLALRCKRCHEPIRVSASEPPGRRSSHPPAPAARSPLPQGPARPKPRPPLKVRPASSSAAVGHHRRKPPPRSSTSKPQLEEHEGGGVNHDLFDAPPPSSRRYIDLSDMAHSEPPGAISVSPPATMSSAPPLFDLAHPGGPELSRSAEDVDFLLGLTGSPGTAATLVSPSLSDLARKAPSEPPPSQPKASAPAASKPSARVVGSTPSTPPAAEPAKGGKGVNLAILLALGGAVGVAIWGFGLTQQAQQSRTESPVAAPAKTSEPDLKAAASEPALAAPTTASSGESAPAEQKPSTSAPAANAAHAPRSPNANPTVKVGASEATTAPNAPAAVAKAPLTPKAEAAAAGTAFDRAAAASALASAAAQASACRKEGDPSGVANVTVTFAPSGRVTAAKLSGPPFAGTATGGCIANTLRHAKIPAFDGEMVTVGKTIVVQ